MKEIERAIESFKKRNRGLKNNPVCQDIQERVDKKNYEIVRNNLAIAALEKQLKGDWIPVSERLPEEKENPITWDYYEYTVTTCICGKYDIRHYKFGRGKWWNGGADMSSIVIAWQPLPKKYKEE